MDYQNLNVEILRYLGEASVLINAHFAKHLHNLPLPTFKVVQGKKYFKISDHHTSVQFFVDKENGDIYKAASWSTPSKGKRGNISDNGTKNVRSGYFDFYR